MPVKTDKYRVEETSSWFQVIQSFKKARQNKYSKSEFQRCKYPISLSVVDSQSTSLVGFARLADSAPGDANSLNSL